MRALLLLTLSLAAYAQDAEFLLRTMVGYNTQKASLPLNEEQKKEADRLGREAQQLGMTGKPAAALRAFHQGTAVMFGLQWSPDLQLASSITTKVDHQIVEPGTTPALTLLLRYPPDQPVKLAYTVTMKPAAGGDPLPLTKGELDSAKLPLELKLALPKEAAGNYSLDVKLAKLEGAFEPKAAVALNKSLPVRVEALQASAAKLRGRLSGKQFPSAEYALNLFERADYGDVSPHRLDFSKEFAEAHRLLDSIDAGKDPYAGQTGDMRKAYRSADDQSLQPYRVFVPSNFDPAKKWPLVMALHGMGGDENSLFDLYANGALKQQAERLGLVIACPKGRGAASMYRGLAEKDVLEVLAAMQKDYPIDGSRIYLMGHSMGAYGTWSTAMDYPEKFAALGLFAGGGTPEGMAKIKTIPQFIVHGDNDKTVNVQASRMMVEAAKRLEVPHVYKEIPGGGHSDIVVPNFAPMLDYLAAQKRK